MHTPKTFRNSFFFYQNYVTKITLEKVTVAEKISQLMMFCTLLTSSNLGKARCIKGFIFPSLAFNESLP